MFCTGCGTKVDDGVRFCTGCGKLMPGATAEPAAAPQANKPPATATEPRSILCAQCGNKVSPEKAILAVADRLPVLTLRKIMIEANLELDEAENSINKLVEKGIARTVVDSSGRTTYTFD